MKQTFKPIHKMKQLIFSLRFLLLASILFGAAQTVLGVTVIVDGIKYEVYISGSGYNAVADSALVGDNRNFGGSIANIASSVSYEYKWSEFVGYNQYGNAEYETRSRILTAPVTGFIDGHFTNTDVYGAFCNCKGLTSVIIPNSVRHLGVLAFYQCTNMTSATIGNSVTSIALKAFYSCTGLTSITIPNSVITIDDEAFYNCSGLTSLSIGNSVDQINKSAFYGCSKLTNVTIPNSVLSIGSFAFCGCSSMINLTLGNSLMTIGEQAFENCAMLNNVDIPNSVTTNAKKFIHSNKLIFSYLQNEFHFKSIC